MFFDVRVEDGNRSMAMKGHCDICGQDYRAGESGGHCRGGEYGGCCHTFSNDASADFHRVGPYSDRSCVDVENDIRTRKDGTTYRVPWRLNKRGEWTHYPEMPPGSVHPRAQS